MSPRDTFSAWHKGWTAVPFLLKPWFWQCARLKRTQNTTLSDSVVSYNLKCGNKSREKAQQFLPHALLNLLLNAAFSVGSGLAGGLSASGVRFNRLLLLSQRDLFHCRSCRQVRISSVLWILFSIRFRFVSVRIDGKELGVHFVKLYTEGFANAGTWTRVQLFFLTSGLSCVFGCESATGFEAFGK